MSIFKSRQVIIIWPGPRRTDLIVDWDKHTAIPSNMCSGIQPYFIKGESWAQTNGKALSP